MYAFEKNGIWELNSGLQENVQWDANGSSP